jgi:hypothetical protein
MQPDNSIHPNRKKVLLIAVISLVFVAAIVVTIVILRQVIGQTTKLSSASDIISSYSIKPISALSTYQQQSDIPVPIQYQLSGQAYSINVTAGKTVTFQPTNGTNLGSPSTVQSQTANFMKKDGLTKANTYWSSDKIVQYTNFASSSTVCQLVSPDAKAKSDQTNNYALACIDINSINKEYSSIKKLLSIHDKTQPTVTFTQAIRNTQSKGDVSFSIINLMAKNKQYKLLFAAVDDNWDYIGDLAAGDPKYAGSKYIVTPEIETKISDSKYNGFIVSQIH